VKTSRRVAIVGVGYSTIGRRTGLTLPELTVQASVAAIADAGITAKDIDGVAVHGFPHQAMPATLTADLLGIDDLAFYSGSIDGAAYSVAAMHAYAAVASGMSEVCLSVRPVLQDGANGLSSGFGDQPVGGPRQFHMPFGSFTGTQFAGSYMRRHMDTYGTTEEQFGAFAIAQREHAVLNDDAIFRTPLTMQDYLNARYISKPARLLDCDYPVDSGSALIFTTEERARDMAQKPVFIESFGCGTTLDTDFFLVADMPHSSPWMAAKRMWAQTDLRPADVDLAGLYDGFTFISMQWLEALGFCGEGESGPFVEAGHTRLGATTPTNTDGGACNVGRRHGANFFIEVTRQLRGGQSGARQVSDAEVGVVSNSVGSYAACALLTAA
jgi:acetyl-CoA acetyltransferase